MAKDNRGHGSNKRDGSPLDNNKRSLVHNPFGIHEGNMGNLKHGDIIKDHKGTEHIYMHEKGYDAPHEFSTIPLKSTSSVPAGTRKAEADVHVVTPRGKRAFNGESSEYQSHSVK